MRIHLLSDLHTEFEPFPQPHVDADVTVLAGDVGVGMDVLPTVQAFAAQRPVVYVPGNHEYYTAGIPSLTRELAATFQGTNVAFLSCGEVTLGGVVFLGCTLWTDLNLHWRPRRAMSALIPLMADYRVIHNDDTNDVLRPWDTLRYHNQELAWLKERLEAHRGETVVVVTHHAPSALSLWPEQRPLTISTGYTSRLDDVVEHSGAVLWIHGHTHQPMDYCIGATRVICNSKGYPDIHVPGFDPALVVEVTPHQREKA